MSSSKGHLAVRFKGAAFHHSSASVEIEGALRFSYRKGRRYGSLHQFSKVLLTVGG